MSSDDESDTSYTEERPAVPEEDDEDVGSADDDSDVDTQTKPTKTAAHDSSDDDDEPAPTTAPSKRARGATVDSEDDEEDSDDEGPRRGKKKRKRAGVNPFILEDVDVASDDEEDEDDAADGADGEMGISASERAEAEKAMRDARRLQDAQRNRRNIFPDLPEAELEKYLDDKYGTSRAQAISGDMVDEDEYDDITRQGLLPSQKDPNLWLCKCRMGEEKHVAFLLMRKFIAYQKSKDPLQIKSVIVKEHMKGNIYIEAYKKSHVEQAIDGVTALNANKIQMVPIKEMVDTLRVVKDMPSLKSGTFVRIKRGAVYMGDLAQVDWIDLAHNHVCVKLVPRIDYTRTRGALRDPEANARAKKNKRRAVPKLFDLEAIKALGGDPSIDGDFYNFEGGQYRRGFLYKQFPLNAIVCCGAHLYTENIIQETDGIKPTIAELERFQESSDKDIQEELASTKITSSAHNLVAGDIVEVSEGELINLRGRVISIDGSKVLVKPDHDDLQENLTFHADDLRKVFKTGDHVKVVGGKYEGDTGLIVRVEEDLVIMFSDLTMHELKVLPKDVQLCADVATGVDSLGQYSYGDLVMLDQMTVGVVVRLEKDALQVLNMLGRVVRVRAQAVHGKRHSAQAVALDSAMNAISVNDTVTVVDGPNATLSGQIKHVFRSFVFVYSRTYPEHGGVFVCRARHLLLNTVNSDAMRTAGANTGLTPFLHSPAHPVLGGFRTGATPAGQAPTPAAHIGGTKVRRDNRLIGKNVRITSGVMKNYYGIVKDATDTTCRVELHARGQTITVDKSRIHILGEAAPPVSGTPGGGAGLYSAQTPRAPDGATPMYAGGRTPMGGGATPMYGSQTPMHEGGRTPYYGGGGATPAYDEAGGRTPGRSAWDPTGANTPARTDTMDDFGGPNTPGRAAQTPNYNPDTPAPFTPASHYPGSVEPVASPFTPGQPRPSPGGGYSQHGSVQSSYVASPMAGGPRSMAMSSTPGSVASAMGGMGSADWLSENMEVHVTVACDDVQLRGKFGVVTGLNGQLAAVHMPTMGRTMTVQAAYLLPVQPEQGNKVKVVNQEDMGVTGSLLSIDGEEGVVKTDGGEIKLYPLAILAKMLD